MKEILVLTTIGIALATISLFAGAILFLIPNSKITSYLFKNYGAVSNIKFLSKKELIVIGIRDIAISILLFILFSLPMLLSPVENSTALVIMMILGIILPFVILYFFGTGITLLLFGLFRKANYVIPPRTAK